MARTGGNPDLVKYQYSCKAPGGVSRNKVYSIALEPELIECIKKVNKDVLRKAWVITLIDQGIDVPYAIRKNYGL